MLFLSIRSLIVFADKTRKYRLATCLECKQVYT